jgi:hypothetical protein
VDTVLDVQHEVQPLLTSCSGAWERRGRSIADGARTEPSLVVWLQVGDVFTDIRLPRPTLYRSHPLDGAQAFSGTLRLEDGVAMWRHDLDTARRLPGQLDRATIEQHGSEVVESGEGYVEYWRRCAPGNAREAAIEMRVASGPLDLDAPGGAVGPLVARLVRVGAYATAVWSVPKAGGCLFERRPFLYTGGAALTAGSGLLRRWAVVGLVGSPVGGRAALAALAALDEGSALPEGWAPVL